MAEFKFLPPPRVVNDNEATSALADWLQQELARMIRSFGETSELRMQVLHVEPARRVAGMVVFADGTDWNPGSGAGLYEYRGGAWQKL